MWRYNHIQGSGNEEIIILLIQLTLDRVRLELTTCLTKEMNMDERTGVPVPSSTSWLVRNKCNTLHISLSCAVVDSEA